MPKHTKAMTTKRVRARPSADRQLRLGGAPLLRRCESVARRRDAKIRRAGTQRLLCRTAPEKFLRAPTCIGGVIARTNARDIRSSSDCRLES